jgi:hypothetical protein
MWCFLFSTTPGEVFLSLYSFHPSPDLAVPSLLHPFLYHQLDISDSGTINRALGT